MPKCPYCEVELDKHPANRCMDAWVQRVKGDEVFGPIMRSFCDGEWSFSALGQDEPLTHLPGDEGYVYLLPEMAKDFDKGWPSDMTIFGHADCAFNCVPEYSTDVAAAMGLLESVDGWQLERHTADHYGADVWMPEDDAENGVGWFSGYANTLPLAICRSIIKAKLEEEE